MKTQIAILIIAFLVTNCHNKSISDKEEVKISENTSIGKEMLDSIIFLKSINFSSYNGDKLTPELAEEVLYKHYADKGYFRADKIPNMIIEEDEDKFAVYFGAIYLVDLNGNEFVDAVIDFWLTPPGASGHCWQPHKAIISDTNKGYKITNEEFIPTNFSIDSVITKRNKKMIYGIDYDCGNRQVLRNLKITLKIEDK